MAENGNAGILCDENIRRAFSGAGDFVARQVRCGEHTLFAYSIDGLTSGGDTSDYVIKPISENLRGDTMEQLFANALSGSVYNSVADPCRDLEEAVVTVSGLLQKTLPDLTAAGRAAAERRSFRAVAERLRAIYRREGLLELAETPAISSRRPPLPHAAKIGQ